MIKSDFDKFIDKQTTKKAKEKPVDWEANKKEWLINLTDFFDTVETFLEKYEKENKLSYNFTKKNLTEDYIGTYEVQVLNINIGDHRVRLDPIGTLLIGAKGRVDLIGANGTVKFVLKDKNFSGSPFKINIIINDEEAEEKTEKTDIAPEWVWKIATPPPNISYIDFKQETFFESLLEVIGG